MDAEETKYKMLATQHMDQQWAEAKGLIGDTISSRDLVVGMAKDIKSSNLARSTRKLSLYFLEVMFKKMSHEILCELDDEEESKLQETVEGKLQYVGNETKTFSVRIAVGDKVAWISGLSKEEIEGWKPSIQISEE